MTSISTKSMGLERGFTAADNMVCVQNATSFCKILNWVVTVGSHSTVIEVADMRNLEEPYAST